jgi:hypothetical protein
MAQSIKEDSDHAAQTRLFESRAELKRMLGESEVKRHRPQFAPQSKIMQAITGGGGAAMLAIGAGSLLLLRPGLVKTVIRFLPINLLVKTLAMKYLTRAR